MRSILAALSVVALVAFAPAPSAGSHAVVAPADSIQYAVSWPQAMSPYGPADNYRVVIQSNKDFTFNVKTLTHATVAGLADSFNMAKPAFSATDSTTFDVTVTPFYTGVAGTPLTKRIVYRRPSPSPAFPSGAGVTVDSSKIVRP